jgi:hypothetical protein
MQRLFAILVLLAGLNPLAMAQDAAITLDGEPFTKRFTGNPPHGDKLLEFVRESESFEKWTKLIGFRYQQLPRIGNDPRQTAAGMVRVIKQTNPKAQSRVLVNERASEAILDFLTWPPDGKFMEFNVFRYVKSTDGRAVVSLQLAYRFTDASPEGAERFKQLRESWIRQAAAFDMKQVHAALDRHPPGTGTLKPPAKF